VPSTSKKQHNFMTAIANNPSFAKKVGVPQSVGKDFAAADKGKRFRIGGRPAAINKQDTQHGSMEMPFKSLKKYSGMKSGGAMDESKEMVKKEVAFFKKKGAPASMIKHEKAEMGMKKGGMARGGMHKMPDGKRMKNSAMNMGGMARYAKGGSIRRMADGGMTAPMAPQPPVDPRQLAAMQAMQNQGAAPMAPPAPGMKKGGLAKYAKGGGIESRGKTKGTVIRMASGGSVSARADGIAQRGKTKFKMC